MLIMIMISNAIFRFDLDKSNMIHKLFFVYKLFGPHLLRNEMKMRSNKRSGSLYLATGTK